MKKYASGTVPELQPLLELTQRVGSNPLLTQASTGNTSMKLNGVLWIKASGRCMADALQDDILIPLDLEAVSECLRQGSDPAERHPGASIETAMHAVLPHRIVLHVHCVNTIAWAVREDGPVHLRYRLGNLPWQWIRYVPSGVPLAMEMAQALSRRPKTDVFVMGNHGLVVAGEDVEAVETLLCEVIRCLAIPPRPAPPADRESLLALCHDSRWALPCDEGLHALGTDAITRDTLEGGLLYPCQALFFGPAQQKRLFQIVPARGVLVSRSITPAELAMLSGLVQVLQRVRAYAPLRYLTAGEVARLSGRGAGRYGEPASAGRSRAPALR
jgi:ribulose-5-phosphate 4-epimerase/fuculose-1-phosphate aldolase